MNRDERLLRAHSLLDTADSVWGDRGVGFGLPAAAATLALAHIELIKLEDLTALTGQIDEDREDAASVRAALREALDPMVEDVQFRSYVIGEDGTDAPQRTARRLREHADFMRRHYGTGSSCPARAQPETIDTWATILEELADHLEGSR